MGHATYYEILGIDPTTGPDGVRAAYRRVAARVHPDAGGTGALFRQVAAAYGTLGDPAARAAYDGALADDPTSGRWPPSGDDPERPASHPPPAVAPPSWPARHPSLVVVAAGTLSVWVGALVMDGLVAIGLLVVGLGVVGMIGSGRVRAEEAALRPSPDPGPGRRFGSDLRFGIPMVLKALVVIVVAYAVRSELRRATGHGRR